MRQPRLQFDVRPDFQQPLANGDGDVMRLERAFDRKQPFAALVLFADANRLVGRTIKLLAKLYLDQRTFLFDDDDQRKTAREFLEALRFDRPGAAEFVQTQAEVVAPFFVNPEFVKRLAD